MFIKSFLAGAIFVVSFVAWSEDLRVKHMLNGFFYVEKSQNADVQNNWIEIVKKDFHEHMELILKTLELRAIQKNRAQLIEEYSLWWERHACSEKKRKTREICQELSRRGVFLMQMPFLTKSPFELKEAEEELLQGQCDRALIRLEKISKTEGHWIPLLNILGQTYSCLGNDVKLAEVEALKTKIQSRSYGQ